MVKLTSSVSEPSARLLPFFLLPPLFGIAAKLMHSRLWFGDYQAVACAGQKAATGGQLYDLNLSCPGMHASVFVYLPGVARVAAALQMALGDTGLFGLYLLLYAAALGGLMLAPMAAHGWRALMPFATLWSGSAVMWGNIAVLLHGLVLVTALTFETSPWLFLGAVVIASWIKPIFLTYLAVVLLACRPLRERIAVMAFGAIAGLLPSVLFSLNGGELVRQWFGVLSHFVYDVTPGYGWFGWLGLAGISGGSLVAHAGYLAYASAVATAGLLLSHRLGLSGHERMWLGLSIAVLLIPRIMSQDVFLLGPGLAVIARRAAEWLAGEVRRPWFDIVVARHGQAIVLVLCGFALAGGLTGTADVLTPLTFLGFSLYLLCTAKAVSGFTLTLPGWLTPRPRPVQGE